ncbi:DUF2690 domain-containing protein [Micromonospora musae]|uniref:DUF2690 domain-containing protein n=1 Tax=Micromonospora musae TaxID=1894970 RepID=UPI003418E014
MRVRLTGARRLSLQVMAIISMLGAGVLGATGPAQAASGLAGLSSVAQAEIAAGSAAYISEAQLATSGCGVSCDGRDPQTFKIYYNGSSYYTCGEDATSPVKQDFRSYGGPVVEIRVSARCRTAWTKLDSGNFNPTIKSFNLSGALRTSESGFIQGLWTRMLNNKDLLAQGCAGSGSIVYCTTAKYRG